MKHTKNNKDLTSEDYMYMLNEIKHVLFINNALHDIAAKMHLLSKFKIKYRRLRNVEK